MDKKDIVDRWERTWYHRWNFCWERRSDKKDNL